MRRTLLTTTGTRRPGAIGVLALAAALTLGACSAPQDPGAGGDDPAATSGADTASATSGDGTAGAGDAAGATVDTAALPDPVAEVNGEEITRAEFVEVLDQQREAGEQQAQAGGAPVDEQSLRDGVLESLVGSTLLTQEAERLGLEAGADEIDAELESLAEQNGLGSADELVAALGAQGLDEEQVREEVGRLLLIDALVDESAEVEPPTDAELQAYYDELTGGQDGAAATGGPEGVPPFEDVRDQLEEQLVQERENEAMATLLDQLEEDAEITRHL